MRVLLEGLLPRLYPELPFLCVHHEGKQDLEKSIPRKLRAWREPGVLFCVVRDNDGADCVSVKRYLSTMCQAAARADVVVRIACQELEAWYLGDPQALAACFGKPSLSNLGKQSKFRDPDAVEQPSKVLSKLVNEFQKVSGARRMAKHLRRENQSTSFVAFVNAVDRMAKEVHPFEN